MNNIFKIVVIFLTISSCSLNKNSKFWTTEKISKDQKTKIEKIFAKEKPLSQEFNPSLKIDLISKAFNNISSNNFSNNSC